MEEQIHETQRQVIFPLRCARGALPFETFACKMQGWVLCVSLRHFPLRLLGVFRRAVTSDRSH